MIYKAIKLIDPHYTNSAGKQNNFKEKVVVAKFASENATTYTIHCIIDKNIDEPIFEANRIAELLNNNRKIFSVKEVELKKILEE